jgi:hypothetical protein
VRTLEEVLTYITCSDVRVGFVAVEADAYESVRAEAIEFCEENNEPYASNPTFLTPHFLILGIPVIACGRA